MTRSINKTTMAVIALTASSHAFAPSVHIWSTRSSRIGNHQVYTTSKWQTDRLEQKTTRSELDDTLPYFATDVTQSEDISSSTRNDGTMSTYPQNMNMAKSQTPGATVSKSKNAVRRGKAASPAHKEGLFSPVVLMAKKIIGEERLNEVRGKVISMHSDVIKAFVDTAETGVGQSVLARLYYLADKNKDGKLNKDEVEEALKILGFTWLKEKQIEGIVKRADADSNGVIDFEEFLNEAPKTLRTNLVKLAKKNGGEMGLLV